MRKSKTEAAETRQHIVDVAAGEFRLNGIHATGLAPLMSRAGLTHGGFYKHFDSKEQLVAEACGAGLADLVERFKVMAAQGGYNTIVQGYLSTGHHHNREHGCPLAAMGSELVRADQATRAVASQGYSDLIDVLADSLGPAQPRSQAVFAMAAMIGALTMSRMMADPQAAQAVLRDVQQHLGR